MILKIAMQCFNDESRDICRHWNNRIKLTRCYRLFKAKVPMILGVDFMPLYFSSRAQRNRCYYNYRYFDRNKWHRRANATYVRCRMRMYGVLKMIAYRIH